MYHLLPRNKLGQWMPMRNAFKPRIGPLFWVLLIKDVGSSIFWIYDYCENKRILKEKQKRKRRLQYSVISIGIFAWSYIVINITVF